MPKLTIQNNLLIRILHIPLQSPHIQETHLQVRKHWAVTYFFNQTFYVIWGYSLLRASLVAQMVKNPPAMQET